MTIKYPGLMAEATTKSTVISCYDVCNNAAFNSPYYIAISKQATNEIMYSYYEDLEDMFYIYDILRKAGV